MQSYSRRRFLNLSAKTITGAGLALGANPFHTLAQAQSIEESQFSDYRALVCVFLDGGCDGFSLMVPNGQFEYQEYASSRGALAVPQHQVIPLNGGNSPLSLHPNAASLQPFYDQGRLAMIANVGTLIQPTSKEQYTNQLVDLPAQLFSHSDQIIQWQQLQTRGRSTDGWGAKSAELLKPFQERDYLTSITLDGSNYWQSGAGQRPFSITESGVLDYHGLDNTNDWEAPRRESFERIIHSQRSHLFERAYADLQKSALNISGELGQILEQNAGLFADVPLDNELAASLSMVAQLIAAQEQLGLRRQIYYVSMRGFDVHDNQLVEQPELFQELSDALAFFQNKLDELGKSNNVTTFTASDFGRSLLSNGDGTDHGWGNHLMVMGGAVNGGQIYGELPSLELNGPNTVHQGRVLPTTAASQYAATLLAWLGLDSTQLASVLPQLKNFNQHDLGFLTT